ncbi:hypothetical protein C8R47DRAFT_1217241 [Mycena vitilis]|nr:hypothetical protein C8R47DRAFT_1217241 [Mycena vitilis]
MLRLQLRNALRSTPRLRLLRPSPPLFRLSQLRPYYQQSPHAPLFFPSDGTPGFGLIIPLYAAALSVLSYIGWNTLQAHQRRPVLSVLGDVERIDREYSTIPFDSYRASVDYYARLFECLDHPEVNNEFHVLALLLEVDPELRESAHTIMRETSTMVHNVVASRMDADGVQTMTHVLMVLYRANRELIKLMEENSRRLLVAKDAGESSNTLGHLTAQ